MQEVLRFQEMTRVPLAPWVVRGLINLRGQIVTAIDLRRRLGLPDAPAGASPMSVILRTEQGAVSLLVDRIGDVREVQRELFEPPPVTLRDLARDMIRGVYKLSGQAPHLARRRSGHRLLRDPRQDAHVDIRARGKRHC